MMRIHKYQVISAAGLVALVCGLARANIEGQTRVASGLFAPMFVTAAPGDPRRLFIAERGGVIRILDLTTGTIRPTPFLSIPSVDQAGEGGLLGMAFHPNYSNVGSTGFGKFYVNVTIDNGGDTSLGVVSPFSNHVREYTVSADANVASLGSQRSILSFVQPQTNHNGGWIGFSPIDKQLYIATGDGGGSFDAADGHTAGTGNSQDVTNNPLGKLLRVDVNGDDFTGGADPTGIKNYAIPPTNPFKAGVGTTTDDGGDDEIWSSGLRNPFRAGFDRHTADLWIGDVGQTAREEIDFQPQTSAGGENYGWRLREGLLQTPNAVGGAKPPGNVDPVYEYDRDADAFGGTVVTGGYVYRGPDPAIQGRYFFLDSRNTSGTLDDNFWTFDPANPFGTVLNIDGVMNPDVGTREFPVSFGEDAVGNLYVAYIVSGEVFRIRTTPHVSGAWNVDVDGNWSAAGNWLGGAPNAIDTTANFASVISAPRTVTVDAPRTLWSLNFNSPFMYTIAGANALTLDVSTGQAQINVLQGSHTISAPVVLNDNVGIRVMLAGDTLSLTGAVTATGRTITKLGYGAVELNNVRSAGLTVAAGTVRINPKGTPNDPAGTSVVNAYSIAAAAKLDLTNNSMIVNYTGAVGTLVNDTRQHLLAGRLTTTSGTAATGLGYGDNMVLGQSTFGGQSVDADSVLIKFTYIGDSNLDGVVDVADLGNLASAWQTSAPWTGGDFDYSGFVDVNDLGLLASNWQAGVGSPLGPQSLSEALAALGLPGASVPEPTAVAGAAGFVVLGLLRKTRARPE
jgi:glucose/arabinose dehydrogenase